MPLRFFRSKGTLPYENFTEVYYCLLKSYKFRPVTIYFVTNNELCKEKAEHLNTLWRCWVDVKLWCLTSKSELALNLSWLYWLWFKLIVFYLAVIYLRKIFNKERSLAKEESKEWLRNRTQDDTHPLRGTLTSPRMIYFTDKIPSLEFFSLHNHHTIQTETNREKDLYGAYTIIA